MAKQRPSQERTSYIISSKESRKAGKMGGKKKGKNKTKKKIGGKGK